MSSVVATIRAGIETRAAAVLTGWSRLRFVHVLDRNTLSGEDQRYGVRVTDGVQVPGAVCAYTLDHSFEVILARAYITTVDGDAVWDTIVDDLEQKAHSLFTDLVQQKAGAASVVNNVKDLVLLEPEVDEDNKFIALRVRFAVNYRVSTL